MADSTPPTPEPEPPLLGLAGYLDEEEVEWSRLLARVHRSIARREVSGQAVELAATGMTGVVLEYLRAIFAAFGGDKGSRRAD